MLAPYTPPSLVDNQAFNAGNHHRPNLVFTNVRLAHPDPAKANRLWKVECRGGRVSKVSGMGDNVKTTSLRYFTFDCKGGFMLPAYVLCVPVVDND